MNCARTHAGKLWHMVERRAGADEPQPTLCGLVIKPGDIAERRTAIACPRRDICPRCAGVARGLFHSVNDGIMEPR